MSFKLLFFKQNNVEQTVSNKRCRTNLCRTTCCRRNHSVSIRTFLANKLARTMLTIYARPFFIRTHIIIKTYFEQITVNYIWYRRILIHVHIHMHTPVIYVSHCEIWVKHPMSHTVITSRVNYFQNLVLSLTTILWFFFSSDHQTFLQFWSRS